MKIIVVSGRKSGVGKTYAAERLLKTLSGWSALKVTVAKGGKACPRGFPCGVCSDIKEPFYIIKDRETINQAGKDTARLKGSGAKQVIWLKAQPDGLKKGLRKALAMFSDCKGVIIEGTSVLRFIKPDINIHVEGRDRYRICF